MKFLVVIIAMFSTVFAWAGAVEWNTVYKVATYDCDNVLLWYSEDASSSARLNIGLYLNWNAQGESSLSGAKYGSGLGDVFVANITKLGGFAIQIVLQSDLTPQSGCLDRRGAD